MKAMEEAMENSNGDSDDGKTDNNNNADYADVFFE